MAGKIGKAARIALMADSHKRGGYESGSEGYRGSGRQNYAYEGDFMPERGYAGRSGRMGYGQEGMERGREMYGQERMSRDRGMYGQRGSYRDNSYDGYRGGYEGDRSDSRILGREGRTRSGRMGSRSSEYDEYDSDEDEYHGGEQPIRAGGTFWMDAPQKPHKLTREMAQEWVDEMENEDPDKPEGGKWTMEQVKPLAKKYGIPEDSQKFIDFYAVMNAMYSDYSVVAKKYGVTTPDFFAEMAKAFICDKDAVKNKTAMYYEYLVKK